MNNRSAKKIEQSIISLRLKLMMFVKLRQIIGLLVEYIFIIKIIPDTFVQIMI